MTVGTSEVTEVDPKRWKALGVLCLVQFMLVLDMTVVNVALPRIQNDLGFTSAGLAWVVNGYVLMAGGLLLLGGRLGDLFGRRRFFMIGVTVFGLASIVSGAAQAPAMLLAGRFAQGVGEALAAPAALGIIVIIFSDFGERMKALGTFGAVSGLAGMFGTLISGVLTDLASWRWIFYINIPVVVIALLLVTRLVVESRMETESRRIDFAGAITATAGLSAIVYGLVQASSHAWASSQVLVPLAAGVVLLGVMLSIEMRSKNPLIPLRFFSSRTRAGAYVITMLHTASIFSFSFLLTLFLQKVLGYTPLQGGLSYIPLGVGIGLGVAVSTKVTPKVGLKPVLAVGLVGCAVGMLLISMIGVDSTYFGGVVPGMFVFGLFSGIIMPAMLNAALHGTTMQDSGLGSATQNVMQQIGGALGLACLVTIALRFASGQSGTDPAVATTNGYALAFRIAAVLLVISAVVAVFVLEKMAPPPPSPAGEGGVVSPSADEAPAEDSEFAAPAVNTTPH